MNKRVAVTGIVACAAITLGLFQNFSSAYKTIGPFQLLANQNLPGLGAPYQLTMQNDGNLVYRYGGRIYWTSNTAGGSCTSRGGCLANFQADGNLVLYDHIYSRPQPYWASNTSGHPGAVLNLADYWLAPLTIYPKSTSSSTQLLFPYAGAHYCAIWPDYRYRCY